MILDGRYKRTLSLVKKKMGESVLDDFYVNGLEKSSCVSLQTDKVSRKEALIL